MVRDQGTPPRRDFARVLIRVHDHNDHPPTFTSELVQARIYESAPPGAAVVQMWAIDRDHGENARLTYSLTSGNVGNVFRIDPDLGLVLLDRELDLSTASEYILMVRATDHGEPALTASVPVHVMITMAEDAPPRFPAGLENSAEIYENERPGSLVYHLEARSSSSLHFEIVDGNPGDAFFINPSTGLISTQIGLDYESMKLYNLSILATSMSGAGAHCNLVVHVLDRNDNAPAFLQTIYFGEVIDTSSRVAGFRIIGI